MTTNAVGQLQLLEVLDFEPYEGIVRFRDQRMVIQGAGAMGLLRRELMATLGSETTRRLLLRFGYADGYHDAVSFRERLRWDDPLEGLRAGLRLQMLEGIVCTEASRLEHEPASGAFEAEIRWRNSYEAEQHLHHLGSSSGTVCWTLVGYISGYASACLGTDVYFREVACAGSGDPRCTLVGRDAARWGEALADLHGDFRGADLRGEVERLRLSVARTQQRLARRERALARRARELVGIRERLGRHMGARNFVVRSQGMHDLLDQAMRVAPLETTVLVAGESGTGKEFVARLIHEESPRSRGPLVTVNCAALTDTLLESELFGHVRGAFTGAVRDKAGLFAQANRGTLLLDEVGEMSPALQAKLLRAIQEREIRPVGGERVTRVDVRVVAATNRDLRAEAANGRFRDDLYFRLAGFELRVPPLRARRDEIPVLAYEFLRRSADRLRKDVHAISADAMTRLVGYSWPGNVRQLEHAMERAVILARSRTVGVRDLGAEIRPDTVEPGGALSLKTHEARLIREALSACRGRRKDAARALGISTVSLWRKMREHRIVPPAPL